jgi:hypothetical protein
MLFTNDFAYVNALKLICKVWLIIMRHSLYTEIPHHLLLCTCIRFCKELDSCIRRFKFLYKQI